MNKNLNLEHLPVFYHIAKNAGTYVLGSIQMLLTAYLNRLNLKLKDSCSPWCELQAQVKLPSGNVCTVLLGDKLGRGSLKNELYHLLYHAEIASQHWKALDIGKTYPNPTVQRNSVYARCLRGNACEALLEKYPNSHTYEDYKTLYNETIPKELNNLSEFSLEEFMSYLQQDGVFIFAVLIEPLNSGSSFCKSELIGWEDSIEFIDKVCAMYNRQRINFIGLREPFSRAISLFNYIKSSDSDHEVFQDEIVSSTFEEYIESKELEDSWLIRQLLCLNWSEPIEEVHYNTAIEKLKSFYVKPIDQIDSLIEEVFNKSYNLSRKECVKRSEVISKNQASQTDILRFDQLSPDLKQKFIDRTEWDKKLYDYFTQ